MNLTKYFDDLRQKNSNIRERRIQEVYAKLPEIIALDEEIRDTAFVRNLSPNDIQSRIDELVSRKAQLLARAGYPADYLDSIYSCAECKDTGYTGDILKTPCRCASALAAKEQERQYGMHPTGASFESFDTRVFPEADGQRARMEKLRSIMQDYAHSFPGNSRPNMLIMGKAGLGKSYVMECAANAVSSRGYSVIRVNSNRLFDMFRKRMFDSGLEARINMFYRCDLLALDDLGVEPMLNNITAESLYDVLNQRMIDKKASMIATNLDGKMLLDRYGDRVYSRLSDKREFVCYSLEGEDIRRR